ncbi:hypothetical protein QBC43DRAFT_77602 [Cladorrhinum sp. PSN259]|nr:hypothetical protein QBC43DRAFT_77602 [Cladorrhinum sp. PSN259]
MDPPDPVPPLPPPPPQPAAKRPSASYADAVRGQKVFFAPKPQPPRNTTKQEFPQFRKQSQGIASSSKPTKQPPGQASEVRSRSPKVVKTGPPQVEKPGFVSELPPMPPHLPPPAKFQESTNIKKAPVTPSSYAQALSGKKSPAPLLRPLKESQNYPAAMNAGQTMKPPTSATDETKSSKLSKAARKAADGASGQPQPVVPAAPAMERINGKHKGKPKGKPKGHQHRKSSAEWKRHSSSSVWETSRNEPSICAATKERGRRFSMGDSPPSPPVTPPRATNSEFSYTPQEVFASRQQAAEEEQKRLRQIEERAERMAHVIAMHDRGELNLWECQYEWDVLIVCNGHEWRLHHDILCRESEWFKEKLPPKDCSLGYVRFELNRHAPEQLGSALHFMYTHNYPNARYSRDYPLVGEPLRVNVFKYICGASVNCSNMMRFAFDRINEATDILTECLPLIRHSTVVDLLPLYNPLGFALAMMYEQGSRPEMLPLRQVMTHLVDMTLMELILNPGFQTAFELRWVEYIYPNLVSDSLWFSSKELLGSPPSSVSTPQRTQDHIVQRHVEERPPPRYRNKSRDLDGPWRRGDVRLNQPWRHDRAPLACSAKPEEGHQPIYLPRPTERPQQNYPARSEARPQPIYPPVTEAKPQLNALPQPDGKPQPISVSQREDNLQQLHQGQLADIKQPVQTDGAAMEKPVPNGWGVWDASTWEKIEHGSRQCLMSIDKQAVDVKKPQYSDARKSTPHHQIAPNNVAVSSTVYTGTQQQSEVEGPKKDTWSLLDQDEHQAPADGPFRAREADEESLIDLDAAEEIRQSDDWAGVGNRHEHEQGRPEEEIKPPQSVSGDWGNPWDIADTWCPPHSGKSLSTRPGEEEDERSTITAFTPVTSTAGDDVMCESIVFEEDDGNEAGNIVGHAVSADDDDFAISAPALITTVTKQPVTKESSEAMLPAAAPKTANVAP